MLHRSDRKGGVRLFVGQVLTYGLLVMTAAALAGLAFWLHVNLSTAVALEMLLVLIVALRLGFAQATAVSILAFFCLNFLFTEPVFTFTVADPQNWVALATFEVTALLVSGLSTKVRLHADHAEQQRLRADKLYKLSRAVLLTDQRKATGEQLSDIVQEILEVEHVELWFADEHKATSSRARPAESQLTLDPAAPLIDRDEPQARSSQRVLRSGIKPIGGLRMSGWTVDPLSADAIASIAVAAFERARAIQRENRAELDRDAERLRTAVLDGLAHGYKTPLTAIQTASSGLMALGHLNATQTELVSIIDERVGMLAQLTTRLLKTAALESKEIRLRKTSVALPDVLQGVLQKQSPQTMARVRLEPPQGAWLDQLDVPSIELAFEQLLDNAAKYSADGSTIVISLKRGGGETAITVESELMEGHPIRPEERTRIFERFYRGSVTAQGPAGTGVGLSIVKKIAEAHGGRAWVECLEHSARFTLAIQHVERESYG